MLKQRIITAVILVLAFLAAVLWLPLRAQALVFGGVAALGAWEWAALSGWHRPFSRVVYTLLTIACFATLWIVCQLDATPTREAVQPYIGSACLFWSATTLLVERYPASAVLWRSVVVRSLMGWLMMAATWLSVVYLLTLSYGAVLVILLILIVAVADIGAYFVGHAWGQHKLAPRVSPGKTWEGLWGGVACVLLLSFVVIYFRAAQFDHLAPASIVIVALACAGASVLGDLTVSMVKRECGVKDSGSLLPGHGGVLDRIDSICGTAPVFALALMLIGY
jgi:phosphatidate cytidylyltransferase